LLKVNSTAVAWEIVQLILHKYIFTEKTFIKLLSPYIPSEGTCFFYKLKRR